MSRPSHSLCGFLRAVPIDNRSAGVHSSAAVVFPNAAVVAPVVGAAASTIPLSLYP